MSRASQLHKIKTNVIEIAGLKLEIYYFPDAPSKYLISVRSLCKILNISKSSLLKILAREKSNLSEWKNQIEVSKIKIDREIINVISVSNISEIFSHLALAGNQESTEFLACFEGNWEWEDTTTKTKSDDEIELKEEQNAYELAVELGVIGAAQNLPPDLSSNKEYMSGFGG